MSQVSHQNKSDGKLPSLGIIQCLRMEVSRQIQSDGKLPSLGIIQCREDGSFPSNSVRRETPIVGSLKEFINVDHNGSF